VQHPSELPFRPMTGHLLATHPEAHSLLSEAEHRQALAEQSAAEVTRRYTVMQVARTGYQERQHRLDPRLVRTIHFGVAMTLLAALFAVLVMLSVVTLDGVLASGVTAAGVAAAAAWTGCAWLAALALREGQRGRLAAIATAALTLGVLLAALHGDAAAARPADGWGRFGIGAVAVLLVFILVAVAAVLIARTEPASLLLTRRRWHQARSAHAAAVRVHRADAEAEAVARQGWQSLTSIASSEPLSTWWTDIPEARHGPDVP
jgi:MFS family permease